MVDLSKDFSIEGDNINFKDRLSMEEAARELFIANFFFLRVGLKSFYFTSIVFKEILYKFLGLFGLILFFMNIYIYTKCRLYPV